MSQPTSYVELLKSTPITNLSIGRSNFRRLLVNKGYSNLIDVLELTNTEIDRAFNIETACTIGTLQHAYRKDPEAFAKKALEKKPRTHAGSVNQPIHKTAVTRSSTRTHGRTPFALSQRALDSDLSSYLRLSFSSRLLQFDDRARSVFDELNDRQDNVIVYQAFDEFATEFDEIDDNFQQLFDYFHRQNKIKTALAFIARYLDNIFLIYVADRARTFHDRGFWKNFFPTIHISAANSDAQSTFKQLFYTSLQNKNMPVYQEDESARHYYLTALLHGGLSQSSWRELWETSILPLARTNRLFGNGSQADLDGRFILKTILDDTNIYTPHKTELDVLAKAPVALVSPLLESALQVGMQVVANDQAGAGTTMLTSYGLPDIAINALIDLKNGHADTGNSTNRAPRREIIALPKADLRLDINNGSVGLYWNKQQFPFTSIERRIDYYIDDKKMGEQPLRYSVGKCTLDAMHIDVAPRPQYEVALKLLEFNKRTKTWKEVASLEQNFERLNPGCFEFIQDAKGAFRLRRPGDRITKKRTIAYIVDKDLTIKPGPGMELVERYKPQDIWNQTTIYVYEVAPGSSGSIMAINEDGAQEEIAVWQENYRSHIDKTGMLGTTLAGIDLYGCVPDENGINIGLPSFYIEAFDGRSALDDLDIVCLCDDEPASIKRTILWEETDDDGQAARIKLSPAESNHFYYNKHINLCTIEARQRSAGDRAIFKYRFCVAPIQNFHLESISLDGYDLNAEYSFEPAEDMYVIDQNRAIQNKDEKGRFTFTMPLSSSVLPVRIVSSLSAIITDALIDLAALDITIPHHLIDRAQSRPLCLPDAQAGYLSGQCGIKASNWSQSRAMLVTLGDIVLYFKEFPRPSTSDFSIFADIQHYLQEDNKDARSLPLRLCVFYGYRRVNDELKRAFAEATLLNCKEGFGFTTWDLRFNSHGDAFVKFDAPFLSDVQVALQQNDEHASRRQGKPFVCTAHEGDNRIPLPKGITSALQRHRTFEMSLTLLDEFAEFDSLFDDDETCEDDAGTVSNGLTTTFTLKGVNHHGE